jgi:acetolactate synthase-1/2/3 large subunit
VPLVVSGPGVANSLTALGDAYADSVPMVLVAACPARALAGKGAFHELKDQTAALAAVTKWNTRAERAEEIPAAIRTAFSQAYGGRPGPTAVEIPVDVQSETGTADLYPSKRVDRKSADAAAVREAAQRLLQARQPIVYLGSGAAISDCASEAIRLAEHLQSPCFATALGQGVVPWDHPLFLSCRWVEQGPGRAILEEADVMLVVGSSLDQVETNGWTMPVPETTIQIDICEEMIGRNYPASIGLVGDAKAVLAQLLEQLACTNRVERSLTADRISQLKRRVLSRVRDRLEWRFVDAIHRALPRDAFVFNDASIANGWVLAFLPRYLPRTFAITRSMAALGYALPSAIGAKVAYPNRQALAVAGDGGFLFTSNALATAVQYRLNAVAVVFNDNCFSSVKRTQDRLLGRCIGVDLHNPDFVKLAEAHGAVGAVAETPTQLHDALQTAWGRDLPTVIEVPMGMQAGLFED